MKHKTDIEWTHVPGYIGATLNPIRARNKATGKVGWFCVHASDGCRNCYAERLNNRFGTKIPFKAQNRDKVETFLDENILLRPLKWKKPHAIFLCDMTDIFEEGVPDEWIDKIFAVAALCPHHIFMVLTKRAKRMRGYVSAARAHPVALEAMDLTFRSMAENPRSNVGAGLMLQGDVAHLKIWPLPNVWLGVSAENQKEADERIPELRATPAAVRFVSAEPLLESTHIEQYLWPHEIHGVDMSRDAGSRVGGCVGIIPSLDWVIVGGESGPGARRHDLAWDRSLMEQCRVAGVPYFEKQLGANPFEINRPGLVLESMRDRKGGDPGEWPEDLRVRQFPVAVEQPSVAP